nr:uncharacterized protein LOC103433704 isoform X4 [Malus domestica]
MENRKPERKLLRCLRTKTQRLKEFLIFPTTAAPPCNFSEPPILLCDLIVLNNMLTTMQQGRKVQLRNSTKLMSGISPYLIVLIHFKLIILCTIAWRDLISNGMKRHSLTSRQESTHIFRYPLLAMNIRKVIQTKMINIQNNRPIIQMKARKLDRSKNDWGLKNGEQESNHLESILNKQSFLVMNANLGSKILQMFHEMQGNKSCSAKM